MTAQRFARLQRATTVVPLALLSAAWTVSLVGAGTGTSSAAGEPDAVLPDGTVLPGEPVEAPATYSRPGIVAPAVPDGNATTVVASATPTGIPAAALSAYQRAEAVINAADKQCRLTWQLIAAIGRVESDHGRFAGNVLDANGLATPGIFGIALDGTRKTTRIVDTDGGRLDGDTEFDRAVGPMQFIPSTWSVVGVDGDADGKRDPQDVDDAALATAVYLCSGDEALDQEAGQRSAVYRYNHSNDYVDLVLSVMEGYLAGDFSAVPDTTTAARVLLPDDSRPTAGPRKGKGRDDRAGETRGRDRTGDGKRGGRDDRRGNGGSGGTGGSGGDSPAPTTAPTPRPEPGPTPTKDPTPKVPTATPTLPAPTPTLPTTGSTPIDTVLTYAEAHAQCLAEGVSALDLPALNACIEDKLAP